MLRLSETQSSVFAVSQPLLAAILFDILFLIYFPHNIAETAVHLYVFDT